MTSPSPLRILIVGGGGAAPPADSTPLPSSITTSMPTPAALKASLASTIATAASKGFSVKIIQLSDPNDWSRWLDSVRETLAGEKWDGFIIGNGIRGTPSLTVLFGRLVACAREVGGDVKLGFNTTPLDLVECMERMFPVQEREG